METLGRVGRRGRVGPPLASTRGTAGWDRLRLDLLVLGPWLFALPVFVVAVFAVAVGMMAVKQAPHLDITNMVMAGIEGVIPLVTGIALATVTAHDPALELHLAVLEPYRQTVLRRCLVMVVWSALLETLAVLLLAQIAPWALRQAGAGALLLTWLAPLLWFSSLGALLALVLRNRAASAAILGVVWVLELLFHAALTSAGWTRAAFVFATMFDPTAAFWLQNRLELLGTALVLFAVVWWYLRHAEWRLRGEEA